MFDLIGFDADDTLWHNESIYRMGRMKFQKLLAKYDLQGSADETSIDERLNEIEIGNLRIYGYGVMSFVLSLIETSIHLTNGQVTAGDIQALVELAKEMLNAEVQLFDGAAGTVGRLASSYPLMLITKGDLQHQGSKIERSGIKEYFRHLEIVSEKSPGIYAQILDKHNIEPKRFLMVGNSLRSDIMPVVEIGGWAIHVPNNLTWSYEAVAPSDQVRQRYFEAEDLKHVPDLVEQIAASLGGPVS
jgi:putative hydrolase of the HAD superfamily